MLQVKGHNGTVSFDGTVVTITRTGFLARATLGKGEKRIPVRQLTAVQFKPAGLLMNGYIAFTIGGGNEKQSQFGSQTYQAVKDENAVVFMSGQQAEFEKIRNAIEAAMAAPAPAAAGGGPDLVGQLSQLAQLRDAGVVSEAEFGAAKARLLGTGS